MRTTCLRVAYDPLRILQMTSHIALMNTLITIYLYVYCVVVRSMLISASPSSQVLWSRSIVLRLPMPIVQLVCSLQLESPRQLKPFATVFGVLHIFLVWAD